MHHLVIQKIGQKGGDASTMFDPTKAEELLPVGWKKVWCEEYQDLQMGLDMAGQLPRSSQNLPFSWRSLEYWWKNRLAVDDPHNSYMYMIIYVIYIRHTYTRIYIYIYIYTYIYIHIYIHIHR